jgi:hypothetical protein
LKTPQKETINYLLFSLRLSVFARTISGIFPLAKPQRRKGLEKQVIGAHNKPEI